MISFSIIIFYILNKKTYKKNEFKKFKMHTLIQKNTIYFDICR